MIDYELLSLLASVLALVIAALSLHRTSALSKKQLALEEISARLSARQLEQMEQEDNARGKARIDVAFIKDASTYRLRISNVGAAEARNVSLAYHGPGSLLIASECAEKFPIKSLRPGKHVELFADPEENSYKFVLDWLNPDGTVGTDAVQVHV
jgi:hypothetical protein